MLYATVKLYGKNGIPGEFKEYESKALSIFRKYGGEVIVAYKPHAGDNKVEVPDEIQILKISTQISFDNFMKDPDRLALAKERESVIRKTEVFLSNEIIQY